jgi:hypothetical protein
MAMDEKVVRYALTHKDLFMFNLRGAAGNRVVQITMVLLVAYGMYMAIRVSPNEIPVERSLAVKIVVALVMGGIMFLLVSGIQIFLLMLMIWTKKHKGVIGEHELTLTEVGVLTRSADGEALRKWTGYLKMVSTNHYFYLYVNETMAQIVPKRYFASTAEAQGFERVLRERMKA